MKVHRTTRYTSVAIIVSGRLPHILHWRILHTVPTARMAGPVRRVPVIIGTAAADNISTGAISRKSLRLVPKGVSTDRLLFRPEVRQRVRAELDVAGEFVWLTIGCFQPVKDHQTMLRAFARVIAEQPRSILLLAGSGPLQGELEELAGGLGLGSRVRFLGARSDVPELLMAADACVLSSVCDTLPKTLVDAAASGLPCVTTDVGGASDIVIHGVTGYLAPPSNPEALSMVMLRLSAMPAAWRKRMGEQARRHAHHPGNSSGQGDPAVNPPST